MPIRSKWLMGFLFSFFLCCKNDELTLPVAKDSHLLNALQICLMDTSCQGLAVTSPNKKYFSFGFCQQIPVLLSQWKTWKGWKRNMRLLRKPSKCRECKIILSRLTLLSSTKTQLGEPAEILSVMQSLKEPPHPFLQNKEKLQSSFQKDLWRKKKYWQVFFSNLLQGRRDNKSAVLELSYISLCIS